MWRIAMVDVGFWSVGVWIRDFLYMFSNIHISHSASGFAQDSLSSISAYFLDIIEQRVGQIRVNLPVQDKQREHSTG